MDDERPPYLDRIASDPEVMVGKPVVRGTRIPVERVLQHLEETMDWADLFAAYPRLTPDDVRACLAFARLSLNQQRASTAGARHATA
jgi:uncharacterized protein (DUF433 family)